MRLPTWKLVLAFLLASLAACGGDDPGKSAAVDWNAALTDAEWAAGHGRVFWAAPPSGEGTEVFLFDQRIISGVCPEDFGGDEVFRTDQKFLKLWVPHRSGGTFALVAHPDEEDYGQAQLRLIEAEDGRAGAVLRAVEGTVTFTPGTGDDADLVIDAVFAKGAELECLYGSGTPDWCECLGEDGETFECEGLGCCFGEGRIPFTLTVESTFCPELCSGVDEENWGHCEGT